MGRILGASLVFFLLGFPGGAEAVEADADVEVYWLLLHDLAVKRELKLSAGQQAACEKLLDGLDLRYCPLRNKPKKEFQSGVAQLAADCRKSLAAVLEPAQAKRLNEIFYARLGTAMLLRDDVAERLQCAEELRNQIRPIVEETGKAVADLRKKAADPKLDSESRESLERTFRETKINEQKRILSLLTPVQRTAWKAMLGDVFDTSLLGQTAFKAPELIDSQEWINSPPLQLRDLRDKVVVVHFYASSCANCIHNYPWYRQWQEKFAGKGVVLIGIHTPETAEEKVTETVRQKAAAEKLAFPILIDGKQSNWNAWGNSIWPCVYLVDKRGYIRHVWPGELKWKGNDGEKIMRERIESLIAEKP
jgi:peroxiredoxin